MVYDIILGTQELTADDEATQVLTLTELSYSLSNKVSNTGSFLFKVVFLKKWCSMKYSFNECALAPAAWYISTYHIV